MKIPVETEFFHSLSRGEIPTITPTGGFGGGGGGSRNGSNTTSVKNPGTTQYCIIAIKRARQ